MGEVELTCEVGGFRAHRCALNGLAGSRVRVGEGEHQFAAVRCWSLTEHVDRLRVQTYRVLEREHRHRVVTGLLCALDRHCRVTERERREVVVSDLRETSLRGARVERVGDRKVQAPPPVDRKVLRDRVSDDRVREPVSVAGRTDAVEQTAGDGVVDRVEPVGDRQVRVVDREQRGQVELGADDGGELEQLPTGRRHVRHPIKDEPAQATGDRDSGNVGGRGNSGRGAVVAQQLPHEQRVATGLFEDRLRVGCIALRAAVAPPRVSRASMSGAPNPPTSSTWKSVSRCRPASTSANRVASGTSVDR